jgi:RNA polymerase sigma factor (sigma-70 family)
MENLKQPTEANPLLGTNFFPGALPQGVLIPKPQLPAPGIGNGIAGPNTITEQDLYELARKIASQKAGGRYYRDDVISEAYLAVAEGEATDKREIENAVRRSLRSEWKWEEGRVHEDRHDEWNDEDGHVPFALENLSGWDAPGAPERAKPDVDGALSALTEKQQTAVILTYVWGLTQQETANRMGVDQTVVRDHLRAAIRAMKKFFNSTP